MFTNFRVIINIKQKNKLIYEENNYVANSIGFFNFT